MKKKILIVEDDQSSLLLFKLYVNKLMNIGDDNIITTDNGTDAINLFIENKENIKFIIMNVGLNGKLNGYETTKKNIKN